MKMTSVAASRPVKLPLATTDDYTAPSKKARTSFSSTPASAAAAAHFPQLPASQPLPSPPAPWMMPAASAPAAPAPGMANPMMMPAMPFFMPPPMMAPQMMAMQACMMMQMQMQAMQSMMQQHQQHGSPAELQSQDPSKPSAATAAAASLNYGSPLPCYPPFAFMPHMPPAAMCFPPASAAAPPAPTPQQQTLPTHLPIPVPHKPQQAMVKAAAPAAVPLTAPAPSSTAAPMVDVESTNLSDKDFAAFIDSFVGDEPLVLAAGAGPCMLKLEALKGGGSMQSCSGSDCTEADEHFSFSLEELLPWDAVTSQVESALAAASPPCLSAVVAPAAVSPLMTSPDAGPMELPEGEGEESDLIFGVCPHLDSLLSGC